MHMANELLSVPVAAGTWALAASGLGWVCKKLSCSVDSDRLSLMGVLGAFVFAAQMVNIPLPGLPGTSGHMIGAVLLAILLGPHAGALAISSVVIIQCLLFQDGGLLAMGCNLINMALVPSYLGFALYQLIRKLRPGTTGTWAATMIACVLTVEVGAILVVLQASLSGVITIPTYLFLGTMLGVHFMVGLLEGTLTLLVIGYLQKVKPELLESDALAPPPMTHTRNLWLTFGIMTLIVAGGISLWASERPDGLEWSYADRPDQPEFKPVVHNDSLTIAKVDALQEMTAPMPDYSKRIPENTQAAAGWTSLAGILGSIATMACLWLGMRIFRRRPQTV